MKYLASLLLTVLVLAALFAPAGQAQSGADTDTPGMFGHTPVPKGGVTKAPSPGAKGPVAKVPLTASLAKDAKGKESATTFTSAETVYVLWKDPTSAKGDQIRTVWYVEDAGKALSKNKKLAEHTLVTPGPGATGSALSPVMKGGLPPGTYRAEVYDGTKLIVKLPFTVK